MTAHHLILSSIVEPLVYKYSYLEECHWNRLVISDLQFRRPKVVIQIAASTHFSLKMHSFDVEKKSQEENKRKMELGQKWVFLATFVNYAMAHWTRKSYTNVKVQLMRAGVSPLTLTAMDSGFMFTYAGGSFITGQLGDRFSPVNVVGAGLLGSTMCLLLIILGASTSIISNAAICGTFFLTCQMLHGAFQATGGPVRRKLFPQRAIYFSRGHAVIR